MTISRRGFTALLGSSLLIPARSLLAAPMPAAHAALYEAAKKEGELTWYSAHYTSEQAERAGREFTLQYPGVKVNVVRTTAQVAYQRLSQDIQSNTANCDVFGSTDMGHYVQLKEKKLLLKYVPAAQAGIDARFRDIDPDGYFHTTSADAQAVWRRVLQETGAEQAAGRTLHHRSGHQRGFRRAPDRRRALVAWLSAGFARQPGWRFLS